MATDFFTKNQNKHEFCLVSEILYNFMYKRYNRTKVYENAKLLTKEILYFCFPIQNNQRNSKFNLP